MIKLNQKTGIRKIERMNLKQNCEKHPTFYTFPLATTKRQLAGRRQTVNLVSAGETRRAEFCQKSFKNNAKSFQMHYTLISDYF